MRLQAPHEGLSLFFSKGVGISFSLPGGGSPGTVHFGDTHHSWVEDPTAALSMPAGGTRARSGGHRGLRERVEGEDLGTGAPSGSRAGGGNRGRSPQDGHGGEGAARVSAADLKVPHQKPRPALGRGCQERQGGGGRQVQEQRGTEPGGPHSDGRPIFLNWGVG